MVETPPSPPEPMPPLLNRDFLVVFFFPLGILSVSAVVAQIPGHNNFDSALTLWIISVVAMVICSIVGAYDIGKWSKFSVGMLAFFGIFFFYLIVSFAGCIAVTGHMKIH